MGLPEGPGGSQVQMYFGSFLAVWLWTSHLALGFSCIFKTGINSFYLLSVL